MDPKLDGWFEVAKTPGGCTYSLRPAARAPIHGFGGLVFISVAVVGVGAGILGTVIRKTLSFGWDTDRVVLFSIGLIFFTCGVALAVLLVRRRVGWDEVTLEAGAIHAIWRVGPMSWGRTVPRSKVAQLTVVRRAWDTSAGAPIWNGRTCEEVSAIAESQNASPPPDGVSCEDYYDLAAEDEGGRRRTLVANYPREMLLALAAELSSRWKGLAVDLDFAEPAVGKLPCSEDTEIAADIRERVDPPRGTKLRCETLKEGEVRITKPASGVFSLGFVFTLFFGVVLLVWAILLAVPSLIGVQAGAAEFDDVDTWVGVGIRALVGLGAIVLAVRIAVYSFALIATSDRLTVVTKDLWWTIRETWERQEIAWIDLYTWIDPNQKGSGLTTRILLRKVDSGGPVFSVEEADASALIALLRKPTGAPVSEFVVVGRRRGPGPIEDEVWVPVGEYDYALQQKTPAGGVSPISPIVGGWVGPESSNLVPDRAFLTKPEMEWVATTLRRVLGVPASDRPTPGGFKAASPKKASASRHRSHPELE